MHDFATILTHSSLPLAKRWMPDGTVVPYGEGKHFKTQERPLTGIADLSALLSKLEKAPRSCMIRGKYRGEEFSQANEPEHKPGLALRRLGLHDDVPHHWLLIEVDNFVPIGADPVLEPSAAISEYVGTLPEAFRSASYHWQMSNSAGLPKYRDKLKVHLWFWSETPYTSERLRAWAEAYEIDTDKSVFNPVQPHYTAAPIFSEGVADPVPVRSGFVVGTHDTVALQIPADLPAPKQLASKAERLTAITQSDPVAQHLYDINAVKSVRPDGALNIECPRSAEHTGESGETTSVYYLAHTNGHAAPAFHCKHEHCHNVPQQAFLDACGYVHDVSADFDVVREDDTFTDGELPSKVNKFLPEAFHSFSVFHDINYIIDETIPVGGMGVIYGEAGSGKTFIAADMALAVARGVPWRGKYVEQGTVVYVCAEGVSGFRNRLLAYKITNNITEDIPIHIVTVAPNLMGKLDTKMLLEALKPLGPIRLIFLDTWARIMVGGDENSVMDTGTVLTACSALHKGTGAMVVALHHAGKDASKGARGSTALRAAADFEILVTAETDGHNCKVTKQKDGELGVEYGFRLKPVTVGTNKHGKEVTSCVVEHCAPVPKAGKDGQGLGHNEVEVLAAWSHFTEKGETVVSVEGIKSWLLSEYGPFENAKQKSNAKTNWARAIKTLVKKGHFGDAGANLIANAGDFDAI